MNECLYWKGYCVCNICKIKDESWTADEWKEGKRWKDPLEINLYACFLTNTITEGLHSLHIFQLKLGNNYQIE